MAVAEVGDGGPPGCAGDFPEAGITAFDDLMADAGSCSDCSCGDPEGIKCLPPEVRFYDDSGCNYFGSKFDLDDAPDCTVFPNGTGAYGAESDEVLPEPNTGECAASGGELSAPEPSWGLQVSTCGTGELNDSCGDGKVCAPAPGVPFESGLCISKLGDVACPAGDFSLRTVYFQNYDDVRACSSCGCGDPADAQCNAHIEFSYNNSCSEEYLNIDDPGSGGCTTLWGSTPSSGKLIVDSIVGGDCAPSGGDPEGSVTPTEPVTVCCTE
jgi:hypothetical protein